jgi:hypothetical protein
MTLPRLIAHRKSGLESFHRDGEARAFDLKGFWAWSASDLVSNANRGILAEYIVAQSLGCLGPHAVRKEWMPTI